MAKARARSGRSYATWYPAIRWSLHLAAAGKKVSVHYVGVSFVTGEEFDASWNRGQPFEFKLGKGQVIPGWDQGVAGMRVGGRRRLTIPSAMAYGARGAGGVIKPHEPLIFVVDLLAVS